MIKKLSSGKAEAYFKWKIQLYHVLKNRPCESGKDKLDMAKAMLDGDLLEYWKLWRKTESSKEKKEATGEVYKKKYAEGDSDGIYKCCLGKVRNRFIKKYGDRK